MAFTFCFVGCVSLCVTWEVTNYCRKYQTRAGETAQLLRTLVALEGDLRSIPSTHMVDHNHL